jgi:peptidoglycan hydrolase CwlO-like protein
MVMAYLMSSNDENNKRADHLEKKIDQIIEKIEKLEYNINIWSDLLNKDLDSISDQLRAVTR